MQKRAFVVSFGIGIVTLLVAIAPLSSAATAYLYPPWTAGTPSDTESGGGVTKDAFYAVGSTGEDRIHFEVLSQVVTTSWDDAFIPMVKTTFYSTVTGMYTVTYTWQLSGSVGIGNGNIFGLGSGHVTVKIKSNIQDVATGYYVVPDANTTVIYDADYGIPIIPWVFTYSWSNAYFTVSTTGMLYSGRTYAIYSYLEGYAYVTSLFLSTNYAWDDLDGYLVSAAYPYASGGGGGGGGGGCVASGTPVLMADGGYLPIQGVKPGDMVMGYNFTTGSMQPVRVTSNAATHVSQVEVINDGLLRLTTVDQPLYVRNGTWQGWVRDPSRLQVGMALFDPQTGNWTAITSITTQSGNFKVWDLGTSPLNNFIANGVLADMKI